MAMGSVAHLLFFLSEQCYLMPFSTYRIGTVILHFEARISTFPPFLSGGDMFQKIKIRKMTISRALD
ncbi:hypothetical protein QSG92_25555, partial [Escherichia coli]|nr:hypothetical protein [Escherichia coli]MDL5233811.1 hypothetical protein [Escherichia coli]